MAPGASSRAGPAAAPPAHWECDVVLADGGTVHLRPVAADDDGGVSLVAELGDEVIAVSRYERTADAADAADVTFDVADAHQGRGIGTALLEHLAAAAVERGLHRFVATVAPDNQRMLDVFRTAGFEEHARRDGGVVHAELLLDPAAARAAVEQREHRSEAASIARLLLPRSVAVIGAGRPPGTVGHQVFRNLLAGGFEGPVYPVNPAAEHVASVKAYPTITDIPGPVDLAVVTVPAPAVLDVVRRCAAKGVAGLVVLSAGFGEVGRADVQTQLRDLARRNGMRLVGPNCLGVVNTAIGLDATFSPDAPVRGRIAMQSQSGALGIALLERSARLGLGVSTFVSVGNKADVSGNDLLQFWEEDPETDVILLYLESVGNPRKFARIARRVSRRKPIVAVKSGRSSAGVRAASSHTAAMATPDTAVDALFHQAGIQRVDTLDELFDTALVLGAQPLPAGHRVAIVGNAGGPGILAADACVAAGLEVPELGAETQAALRTFVDPNAATANPVDLVASAAPAIYERALEIVLADPGIDAAIVVCIPTFATPPRRVADVLRRAARTTDKTLVGCLLAWPDRPSLLEPEDGGRGVPTFASPEPAARSLARAADYAAWRRRDPGREATLDGFDVARARGVVDDFLAATPGGGWLAPAQVDEVLSAAGVRVTATLAAATAAEAAAAASTIGGPVALKAAGPDLVHKSDVGGVRLGLTTPASVAEAYEEMRSRIGPRMTGAVVQQMAAPGVETIVGVVQDPLFGPLVMFGMGGTAAELLADRSFRILPVTDADAADLVRSLRTSPLLFGYRGAPPVDVAAVEDVLQRVARLAGLVPEVAEMDINPLVASPSGALAVDARVRVAPVPPGPPADLRQMR